MVRESCCPVRKPSKFSLIRTLYPHHRPSVARPDCFPNWTATTLGSIQFSFHKHQTWTDLLWLRLLPQHCIPKVEINEEYWKKICKKINFEWNNFIKRGHLATSTKVSDYRVGESHGPKPSSLARLTRNTLQVRVFINLHHVADWSVRLISQSTSVSDNGKYRGNRPGSMRNIRLNHLNLFGFRGFLDGWILGPQVISIACDFKGITTADP